MAIVSGNRYERSAYVIKQACGENDLIIPTILHEYSEIAISRPSLELPKSSLKKLFGPSQKYLAKESMDVESRGKITPT